MVSRWAALSPTPWSATHHTRRSPSARTLPTLGTPASCSEQGCPCCVVLAAANAREERVSHSSAGTASQRQHWADRRLPRRAERDRADVPEQLLQLALPTLSLPSLLSTTCTSPPGAHSNAPPSPAQTVPCGCTLFWPGLRSALRSPAHSCAQPGTLGVATASIYSPQQDPVNGVIYAPPDNNVTAYATCTVRSRQCLRKRWVMTTSSSGLTVCVARMCRSHQLTVNRRPRTPGQHNCSCVATRQEALHAPA